MPSHLRSVRVILAARLLLMLLTLLAITRPAPALALDPGTLGDERPIDQSPRPIPMPTVQAAPPTMVPEESSAPPELGLPSWRLPAGVGFAVLLGVTFWSYLPREGAPSSTEVPVVTPQTDAVISDPPPDVVPPAPIAVDAPPPPVILPQKPDKPAVIRPELAVPPPPPQPVVEPAIVTAPAPVATTGRIDLDPSTDASRVEALGPQGRVQLPADLPLGDYELYAWFPDAPNAHTGRVVVVAGENLRLRCMAFSMSCRKR